MIYGFRRAARRWLAFGLHGQVPARKGKMKTPSAIGGDWGWEACARRMRRRSYSCNAEVSELCSSKRYQAHGCGRFATRAGTSAPAPWPRLPVAAAQTAGSQTHRNHILARMPISPGPACPCSSDTGGAGSMEHALTVGGACMSVPAALPATTHAGRSGSSDRQRQTTRRLKRRKQHKAMQRCGPEKGRQPAAADGAMFACRLWPAVARTTDRGVSLAGGGGLTTGRLASPPPPGAERAARRHPRRGPLANTHTHHPGSLIVGTRSLFLI